MVYNEEMETASKTGRWSMRVTPAQDAIVRQVVASSGLSLNDYVVSSAIAAAANDLADRKVFAVEADQWDALQALLDEPPVVNGKLQALLSKPSVLESQ